MRYLIQRSKGFWLSHYWGLVLVFISLYFEKQRGSSIDDVKAHAFIALSLTSVFLFQLKRLRVNELILPIGFVLVGGFNMWSYLSQSGMHQWINIFCGALLFIQAKEMKPKLMLKYFKFIGSLAAVSILIGFLDLDYYGLFTKKYYPSNGHMIEGQRYFEGLINSYGYTGILVAIGTCMGGWVSLVLGLAALIKVASLGSISPLMAFLVGALWRFADSWKKRSILFLMVATAMGGHIALTGKKNVISRELKQLETSPRIKKWKEAFRVVLKNPVIGVGPGFYPDIKRAQWIKRYDSEVEVCVMRGGKVEQCRKSVRKPELWTRLHNEFLELIFAYGILGAVLVFGPLKKAWRNRNERPELWSGFIAAMVLCLTWFPFHIVIVSPMVIIIVSLLSERNFQRSVSCGRA